MSLLNGSGSVVAGGVAQTLFPASVHRVGFGIQNHSNQDLWINELGGAAAPSQPSWRVGPGGYFESPKGAICEFAVSVYGANTGQAFTARDWKW